MKKIIGLLLIGCCLFGAGYDIGLRNFEYQFTFPNKVCKKIDFESKKAFIAAINDNEWVLDGKPIIKQEGEIIIVAGLTAKNEEVKMIFTSTIEACNIVSKKFEK